MNSSLIQLKLKIHSFIYSYPLLYMCTAQDMLLCNKQTLVDYWSNDNVSVLYTLQYIPWTVIANNKIKII